MERKRAFAVNSLDWNMLNCAELFCLANLADNFASLLDTAEKLYCSFTIPCRHSKESDFLSASMLFFRKILPSFLSILSVSHPDWEIQMAFFFFLDKKSKFSWSYKLEVLEYLQNASYFKRLGLELTCTLSQDCIHKLLEAIKLNCSPHISFQILPQSCDGSFLCVFIS